MTSNDHTDDDSVQEGCGGFLDFTFVFDDSLPRNIWIYEGSVESHGGTVATTVSEGTDYLVIGVNPEQTEVDSAREYDVPTLSEEDFLQLHAHRTS